MASLVDELDDDEEVGYDEEVVLEEDDELDKNEYMMLCKILLVSGKYVMLYQKLLATGGKKISLD